MADHHRQESRDAKPPVTRGQPEHYRGYASPTCPTGRPFGPELHGRTDL